MRATEGAYHVGVVAWSSHPTRSWTASRAMGTPLVALVRPERTRALGEADLGTDGAPLSRGHS